MEASPGPDLLRETRGPARSRMPETETGRGIPNDGCCRRGPVCVGVALTIRQRRRQCWRGGCAVVGDLQGPAPLRGCGGASLRPAVRCESHPRLTFRSRGAVCSRLELAWMLKRDGTATATVEGKDEAMARQRKQGREQERPRGGKREKRPQMPSGKEDFNAAFGRRLGMGGCGSCVDGEFVCRFVNRQ